MATRSKITASEVVPGSRLATPRAVLPGRMLRSGARAGDLGRQERHLGGIRADADAVRLERLLLCLRGAGRARDDRARVANRLPRRRRKARDVRDDGLRHLALDELGGLLLLGAADLADHDDEIGLRIGLEAGQD